MTRETVEMTEQIRESEEKGIAIEYYTLNGEKPVLHICPGDLKIICNVLHDYSQMLFEAAEINTGFTQGSYIYHAKRCRKIKDEIEKQMGYSTEAAIEKCIKRHGYVGQEPLTKGSDVGEDALVLAMKQRHRQKKAEQLETEQTIVGDSPERGNHEIYGISRRESSDQGQESASRGNGEACEIRGH